MGKLRNHVPHPQAPNICCWDCSFRLSNEWHVLTRDEIGKLDNAKTVMVFSPEEVVFHQGNPCTGIYTLRSGTLALRQTDSSGHSILFKLVHSRQTFGTTDYFADTNYSYTAQALEECMVCHIEKSTLAGLLLENPMLSQQFLHRMAADCNVIKNHLIEQSFQPVRARLARLLVDLKERFGEVDDQGAIVLNPPLSRQDLADLLGARQETIVRALHSMQEEGVVLHTGRTFIIPDLDSLLDEMGAD